MLLAAFSTVFLGIYATLLVGVKVLKTEVPLLTTSFCSCHNVYIFQVSDALDNVTSSREYTASVLEFRPVKAASWPASRGVLVREPLTEVALRNVQEYDRFAGIAAGS